MPHIRPKKRLGQHFLQDPGVLAHMTQCIAPRSIDHVLEIGPGLGALTRELLPHVQRLDAIELDAHLIPSLRKNTQSYHERLNIFHQDALKIKLVDYLTCEGSLLRVVGNLPYNISTPLLFHLMEQAEYIEDMHIMLQQEVAYRLSAQPNCKNYGRLSLMVQPVCQVVPLFDVGPQAFYPPPRIHSTVVRLTPYRPSRVTIDDPYLFAQIVKKAFGQRRKTLGQSLKEFVSPEYFKMLPLPIQPTARAEQVTLQEFVALSNSLSQRGSVS